MPLIQDTGYNGITHCLDRANNGRGAVVSPGALPFPSHMDIFADGSPALGTRALGDANPTIVMANYQRFVIRVIATTCSSISLASALLAIYWFYMMRRNFRRDLVLLLILAGSWKSLWFLIFSGVTYVHGDIASSSPFCQASGYLLLVGFESCDIAILFMSMHMCLQVFPPSRGMLGHDGLYSVRRYVFAFWFLLPHILASLVFINSNGGYVASGAFCFLPVRPLWYRLALYWVPRYLIWVYVTYVALRIYRHVGAEFRVFGQERDPSSGMGMPGESSIDRAKQHDEMKRRASQANASVAAKGMIDADVEGYAPDDTGFHVTIPPEWTKSANASTLGKDAAPEWTNVGFTVDSSQGTPTNRSMPTSPRGSKMLALGALSEVFTTPAAFDPNQRRGSISSVGSKRSGAHASFAEEVGLTSINEGLPSQSAAAQSEPGGNTANKIMEFRRRAIQRQLRLLFIYPCVYLILWVIPFVCHCMNYTTYYAHHPIFELNVVQIICMCSMTFVDVIIFSWREKPWRHIPGCDGTFWGSICWWRYLLNGSWARGRREIWAPSFPEEGNEEDKMEFATKSARRTGLLASIKRLFFSFKVQSPRGSDAGGNAAPPPSAATSRPSFPHKRTYSGGSDRRHLETERAHERLIMERADYEQNRRSLNELRASVIHGKLQRQDRRDWFDRTVDEDLFRDKDGAREEGERRGTV